MVQTSLEMTREREFSRPPFQNIEARTSLKTERADMDLQLNTAKRNLMETTGELVLQLEMMPTTTNRKP